MDAVCINSQAHKSLTCAWLSFNNAVRIQLVQWKSTQSQQVIKYVIDSLFSLGDLRVKWPARCKLDLRSRTTGSRFGSVIILFQKIHVSHFASCCLSLLWCTMVTWITLWWSSNISRVSSRVFQKKLARAMYHLATYFTCHNWSLSQ